MKKLPSICPSCEGALEVTQLSCTSCETKVSGNYSLPLLLQLTYEEQQFLLDFILYSGSLKKMAEKVGKSYPTVRNYLDDLIEKINQIKESTI